MPLKREEGQGDLCCVNAPCGSMEEVTHPEVKSWAVLPVNSSNQVYMRLAFGVALFRCNQCGYVEMYDKENQREAGG